LLTGVNGIANRACGSSVGEQVQLMTPQNYEGFEIGLSTDHNDRTLTRLTNQVDCDVLWIPDGECQKSYMHRSM
jgi:hypothetical protein